MDILRILDELDELAVEQPRKIFGKLYYGLDPDEVHMLIVKVRASLPQEVKQAVQTVRESDRIVETAREDASMTVDAAKKESDRLVAEAQREVELILSQARAEQQRMVAESEVLKLAKSQAEEIRNAADREALQLRRGAEKYAIDTLGNLESYAGKIMSTIERGKQELRGPEPVSAPVREKVRV
jgi:regulator of protease activity HflC (stomatin/prohibitin superfamily)